jgi:hypothetical protein
MRGQLPKVFISCRELCRAQKAATKGCDDKNRQLCYPLKSRFESKVLKEELPRNRRRQENLQRDTEKIKVKVLRSHSKLWVWKSATVSMMDTF